MLGRKKNEKNWDGDVPREGDVKKRRDIHIERCDRAFSGVRAISGVHMIFFFKKKKRLRRKRNTREHYGLRKRRVHVGKCSLGELGIVMEIESPRAKYG